MQDWMQQMRDLAGRQPRRYPSLEAAAKRMREENAFLSEEQALHLTVHGVNRNEDGSYSWKFDNYTRTLRALPLRRGGHARALAAHRLPGAAGARRRLVGGRPGRGRPHGACSRTRARSRSRRPATGCTTTSSTRSWRRCAASSPSESRRPGPDPLRGRGPARGRQARRPALGADAGRARAGRSLGALAAQGHAAAARAPPRPRRLGARRAREARGRARGAREAVPRARRHEALLGAGARADRGPNAAASRTRSATRARTARIARARQARAHALARARAPRAPAPRSRSSW